MENESIQQIALGGEIAFRIEQILALHKTMKGAYFWHSPGHAFARRAYEKNHSAQYISPSFDIIIKGKRKDKILSFQLNLECKCSCSCKNVYYHGHFYVNGVKTTATRLRNIAKMVRENEVIIKIGNIIL